MNFKKKQSDHIDYIQIGYFNMVIFAVLYGQMQMKKALFYWENERENERSLS